MNTLESRRTKPAKSDWTDARASIAPSGSTEMPRTEPTTVPRIRTSAPGLRPPVPSPGSCSRRMRVPVNQCCARPISTTVATSSAAPARTNEPAIFVDVPEAEWLGHEDSDQSRLPPGGGGGSGGAAGGAVAPATADKRSCPPLIAYLKVGRRAGSFHTSCSAVVQSTAAPRARGADRLEQGLHDLWVEEAGRLLQQQQIGRPQEGPHEGGPLQVGRPDLGGPATGKARQAERPCQPGRLGPPLGRRPVGVVAAGEEDVLVYVQAGDPPLRGGRVEDPPHAPAQGGGLPRRQRPPVAAVEADFALAGLRQPLCRVGQRQAQNPRSSFTAASSPGRRESVTFQTAESYPSADSTATRVISRMGGACGIRKRFHHGATEGTEKRKTRISPPRRGTKGHEEMRGERCSGFASWPIYLFPFVPLRG